MRLLLESIGAVEVAPDDRVLDALLARDLNVLMACGGKGLCATCHVQVCDGADGLSAVTARERMTLGFVVGAGPDSRLACQARIRAGGVRVRVPDGMFIERAEDLTALIGRRARRRVLHPVTGATLIDKGKIITRSRVEELKSLDLEVSQLAESARRER